MAGISSVVVGEELEKEILMEYGRLGTTVATVSRICLGMMTYGKKSWRPWILEEDEARPLIRAAIDAGITFFDTADVYSLGASEEMTGRLLREYGPSRDQLVVATKVFYPMSKGQNDGGLSRKHIVQSVDSSLKRLDWPPADTLCLDLR